MPLKCRELRYWGEPNANPPFIQFFMSYIELSWTLSFWKVEYKSNEITKYASLTGHLSDKNTLTLIWMCNFSFFTVNTATSCKLAILYIENVHEVDSFYPRSKGIAYLKTSLVLKITCSVCLLFDQSKRIGPMRFSRTMLYSQVVMPK